MSDASQAASGQRPRSFELSSLPSWLSPQVSVTAAALVSVQLMLLLLVLLFNQRLGEWHFTLGIAFPVAVALASVRSRYAASDKPIVRLLKLLGLITGAYALTHYPFFPLVVPGWKAEATFAIILGFWAAAVACGVLCLKFPGLALVSASYLVWSKQAVGRVTGLEHHHIIDVSPLAEVALCLTAGLVIARLFALVGTHTKLSATLRGESAAAATLFSQFVLAAAISIHLGNYYSSFLAKAQLDGNPISWMLNNNPGHIFLVALDNNHIFFSSWTFAVDALKFILAHTHALTNGLILVGQGLALVGILMPRRWLLVLLLGFDAMHFGILLILGANFLPWILLNLAIAVIVISEDYKRPPLAVCVFSVLFILSDSRFMSQAWLGWYDTLANNKVYFEAIDKDGSRHYVPTNFLTFYSYPFAHMAYGSPDATNAFALDTPNGGAQSHSKVVASASCDVPALTKRDGYGQDLAKNEINGPAVSAFMRGYHALAVAAVDRLGFFPHAFYPHHFYVPTQYATDFDNLNLRDIVAYVYRRESICLRVENGVPIRQVMTEAEHRIDLLP